MPAAQSHLKITYVDGTTQEIFAGPRAQVDLERHFKISLQEANRIEHVYYLAWAALHFAGQEPRNFDEFLEHISDVDALGDVDANPTQDTLPLANSSSSA